MEVKFRFKSNVAEKLGKYELNAERFILDALDQVAGLVQEHARAGHPKVGKGVMQMAGRAMSQGEVLDMYRERTGLKAGEFSGMLRWLTHTGVTRNSIQKTKAKKQGAGFSRTLSVEVFSAQQHMTELEFGTATRRAFPTFRPALIANEERGNFLIKNALESAGNNL